MPYQGGQLALEYLSGLPSDISIIYPTNTRAASDAANKYLIEARKLTTNKP